MGRLLRVALFGIALALVLAAAGQTFPSDVSVDHADTSRSIFAADCPGGTGPACVDLDVQVKDFPDPVPAGDEIDYLVTLANHGPGVAPAATLTVHLPDQIIPAPPLHRTDSFPTFTANDGTPCNFSSEPDNHVTCDFRLIENTDIPKPGLIGPRTVTIKFAADPQFVNQKTGHADYPRPISVTANVPQTGDTYFDRSDTNNSATANTTVLSPGALTIVKSHSDPLSVAGDMTYTLKLTNTSFAPTLPATGTSSVPWAVDDPITVTDTLPHGFTLIRTGDESDNCSATVVGILANSVVTCHPQRSIDGTDPALPGPNFYNLVLHVRPQATGHFVNTADVSKYGGDIPSAAGKRHSVDLTNVGCPPLGVSDETVPQLCVTKVDETIPADPSQANSGFPPGSNTGSDDSDPGIYQGKPFTYRIKVTNTRRTTRGSATDAQTLTDTLPAGMSVVGTSVTGGAGGSCDNGASGTLHCTLKPDIVPGVPRTILVTAVEANTGTFENLACIDGQSCAIEWTEVHAAGDLAITKTVSAPTVNVFGQVTYTLTATNNGPSAMPNAIVTDDIQAHLELVSINPGGPTCGFTGSTDAGGTVSCNLGTLAKGQTKTISIVVSPQEQGTYSNVAKIVPDSTAGAPIDIDLTNNTSATVTFLANAADLSIAKTASPDVVGVGQTLTYTVVVTNNGPGDASGVVVKDPLPTALSFATASSTAGSCTGTQTITCNVGDLANTGTAVITIRATPTAPGTVTNTASVTSTSSDLNDANNSDSVTNRVIAADLSITKVGSPNPVALGIPITYTIKVKNNGPDAATGVTVVDSMPSQVTLATPTPSQGTCFGNVTCDIGNLAVGATATVTITATPFVPDVTITNTAQVQSSFDLNSANNSASASTRVNQPVLDITPDVGRVGSVPFAVGTKFPPNATVILRWNRGLGKKVVVTNSSGGFRAPMLVFSHDLTGVRGLVASAADPNVPAVAFVSPTAIPFRVLSSTSQPFRTKPKFPGTVIIQRGG
jgi:uncharacterized repeat protein (TIGR01451 family)